MNDSVPAFPFAYFFFFNEAATTEIYTLSLHDALPISEGGAGARHAHLFGRAVQGQARGRPTAARSEEHTSELQSHVNLVCRLLLEKKKAYNYKHHRPLSRRREQPGAHPHAIYPAHH